MSHRFQPVRLRLRQSRVERFADKTSLEPPQKLLDRTLLRLPKSGLWFNRTGRKIWGKRRPRATGINYRFTCYPGFPPATCRLPSRLSRQRPHLAGCRAYQWLLNYPPGCPTLPYGKILPGFRMWLGSKAALMRRITSIWASSSARGRYLRRVTPIPCSPVIIPPSDRVSR